MEGTTPTMRWMTATACVVFVLLLLRALLTVDPYFDSFAYHLPFAARLAGLCPESCYQLGDYLEAAYDGFPTLFHVLLGWTWRLTGSVQIVDLLNFASLLLFCQLLRRWFQVPFAWSFLALLAVPLIQIHVTATYIDLPVNFAIAAAVLAVMQLVREPEVFGWRRLALLAGCLAFAANSKPQMSVVALALLAVFALLAAALSTKERRPGFLPAGSQLRWLILGCVLVFAGMAVCVTLIENTWTHGNPIYPLRLTIGGLQLHGTIDASGGAADSLAAVWRDVPSPLRWLASVLEYGSYGYRELPWTYDQAFCETPIQWQQCAREPTISFRMGGYFAPYVLGLMAFLFWQLTARKDRHGRLLAVTFILTTLFAALLPRSHELRYYSFWVMLLIALCLISVFDRSSAGPSAGERATASPAGILAIIVLVALMSTITMTQGHYLAPAGYSMHSLSERLGIAQRVAEIPDGAVACVDSGWQPFTFLFTTPFHPGRSYTVVNGESELCTVRIAAP